MALRVPRLATAQKWATCVYIAIAVAGVAFVSGILTHKAFSYRNALVVSIAGGSLRFNRALAMYVGFSTACAALAAIAVAYVAPSAGGSGVSELISFWNGVDLSRTAGYFSLRTFFVKVAGSILVVSAGLPLGKEGALLHIGSCIAALMPRGSPEAPNPFLSAASVREVVAIGAAGGVSAAFQAPIGGMLYIMELCTRWRQELTWRTFFTTGVAAVSLRLLTADCERHAFCGFFLTPTDRSHGMQYTPPLDQVLQVAVLGVLCGLTSAAFQKTAMDCCKLRKRWWACRRWALVTEVVLITAVASCVFFILPLAGTCLPCVNDDTSASHPSTCSPGAREFDALVRYRCTAAHYNDMAVLVFNPHGDVIRGLLTVPLGTFSVPTLLLYGSVFACVLAVSLGASVPVGLYTPTLILGAMAGRLYAHLLLAAGVGRHVDAAMYAFLGAAGMFGGLMRVTVSMVVVLLEMTQSEATLPFLMLVMIIAKGTADRFSDSIFIRVAALKKLPYIKAHAHLAVRRRNVKASDVMDTTSEPFYLREHADILREALSCDATWRLRAVVAAPEGLGGLSAADSRSLSRCLTSDTGGESRLSPGRRCSTPGSTAAQGREDLRRSSLGRGASPPFSWGGGTADGSFRDTLRPAHGTPRGGAQTRVPIISPFEAAREGRVAFSPDVLGPSPGTAPAPPAASLLSPDAAPARAPCGEEAQGVGRLGSTSGHSGHSEATEPLLTPALVGYVMRADVKELLAKASTQCSGDETNSVDLSSILQVPPMAVTPGVPLEEVYRIFNHLGVEHLPVVQSYGALMGSISRAQLLRCQTRLEIEHDAKHSLKVVQALYARMSAHHRSINSLGRRSLRIRRSRTSLVSRLSGSMRRRSTFPIGDPAAMGGVAQERASEVGGTDWEEDLTQPLI